jgi:recombination protein RecT
MTPEAFSRIAMTSVQRTPALQECTPASIVGCVIQSAQLRLEPDGVLGQAFLVPYKQKGGKKRAVFIPGYKGLLTLARRSGVVESIMAQAVYENDYFDFCYGLEQKLEHRPEMTGERGDVVAFYAVARLKGGGTHFEVMPRPEVDKIRDNSPSKGSGPWATHYDEMGRKTVCRRLCKWLPLAIEDVEQRRLSEAVVLDEKTDAGIFDDDVLEGEIIQEEPVKGAALEALADEAETEAEASKDTPEKPTEAAQEDKAIKAMFDALREDVIELAALMIAACDSDEDAALTMLQECSVWKVGGNEPMVAHTWQELNEGPPSWVTRTRKVFEKKVKK